MKGKNSKSVQVEFENGGVIARRKTEWLADGAYFFEDDFAVEGVLEMTLVTCDGWLAEFLEIEAGEFYFRRGAEKISLQAKRIGIFYPSFSITKPCFKNGKGRVSGIGDVKPLPERFSVPMMFEIDFSAPPKSVKEIVEILDSCQNPQMVEFSLNASLLSLRAKKLIDENYRFYPSISRIAARLEISHEHLTRQFRSDFGMTPSAYLRQLRVADAAFRLSKGEPIIEVSGDVGYNDLSRFYKQFRRQTTKTPSFCQTLMKPERARK